MTKTKKAFGGLLSLLAIALGLWLYRYPLALTYARANPHAEGELSETAWDVLAGFSEREGLQSLIRDVTLANAERALDDQHNDPLIWRQLIVLEGVHLNRPDMFDRELLGSWLIVQCLVLACTYDSEQMSWPYALQAVAESPSPEFIGGVRAAVLKLGARAAKGPLPNQGPATFEALTGWLVPRVESPDSELANALGTYAWTNVLSEESIARVEKFLAHFAAADGSGKALLAGMMSPAASSDAGFLPTWEMTADELSLDAPSAERPVLDALFAQCRAHSARQETGLDEACLDLVIAWAPDSTAYLAEVVAAGDAEPAALARRLMDAQAAQQLRDWRVVGTELNEAEATATWYTLDAAPGKRGSALGEVEFHRGLDRALQRDANVLARSIDESVPALRYLYGHSVNLETLQVASTVLAAQRPDILAVDVIAATEQFLPHAWAFMMAPDADFDRAAYAGHGLRVAAGLLALKDAGVVAENAPPFIYALSIPERSFLEFATENLREHLSAAEFADALFQFLAVRDSFRTDEVMVYENALTSYEGVGPDIERNLATLLQQAGSQPEEVPWIQKLIGLRTLGSVGGPSARELLKAYALDTSSYTESRIDEDSGATHDTQEHKFSDLANESLELITKRMPQ